MCTNVRKLIFSEENRDSKYR